MKFSSPPDGSKPSQIQDLLQDYGLLCTALLAFLAFTRSALKGVTQGCQKVLAQMGEKKLIGSRPASSLPGFEHTRRKIYYRKSKTTPKLSLHKIILNYVRVPFELLARNIEMSPRIAYLAVEYQKPRINRIPIAMTAEDFPDRKVLIPDLTCLWCDRYQKLVLWFFEIDTGTEPFAAKASRRNRGTWPWNAYHPSSIMYKSCKYLHAIRNPSEIFERYESLGEIVDIKIFFVFTSKRREKTFHLKLQELDDDDAVHFGSCVWTPQITPDVFWTKAFWTPHNKPDQKMKLFEFLPSEIAKDNADELT
jgi:hypothetical protein